MSEFYAYICTKTTADPYVPRITKSVEHLSRDVSDGFSALSGGHNKVGQLAIFPIQRSVPDHLLCDGREVSKVSFPELYTYLGSSQGAATDPDKFVLPDYLTAFDPAAATVTETETGGTVSTPPPTPPVGDPEPDPAIYGDTESGGRPMSSTARDTSFATINSATYVPISDELVVLVGASGTVDLMAAIRTAPVGPVRAIYRWWDGAAWADVGTEETSDPSGDVSIDTAKTGLTPGATAKFKLYARNESGTTTRGFTGAAGASSP